jgi:LPXTG-site transpeptidase (sortase) family protein
MVECVECKDCKYRTYNSYYYNNKLLPVYQRGNNPECIHHFDCLSIRPIRVFNESQIDSRRSMNCIGCKDYKPKEIKNEDDIKQYCSIFRRHIDLDFACKHGEIKESDENTIVKKDILTDNDKKILAVICLRHGILKKDIISIQADYDGYLYIPKLNYKNVISTHNVLDENKIYMLSNKSIIKEKYGNIILSGHNNKYVFSKIYKLNINDEIIISDFNNEYKFIIYEIKYINIKDKTILDNIYDKKIVTLITCTNNTQTRYIVRGSLNHTISHN